MKITVTMCLHANLTLLDETVVTEIKKKKLSGFLVKKKSQCSCDYINCVLHTKLLGRLHANLWSNSAVIWHTTDPENSNKRLLGFSHLSRQNCSKGFQHQSPH